ncbi:MULTISPECIES: electron transfer flavoprotein subunit alpha/FixB family protein [Anaerococcus]|jgi:electron transfer flavoprotein alpha subunit|uniref:Electron transfer flavoprotein large subunit n=1 Tax=Anaerococcus octavius TaxID=54007 RepID=A0A2I1MAI7_9FIRM|nr:MULTISPECIES: electron transfer flavoprotein subunit alpha/FixB family protein [Anaerococcus]MBS6105616.1 electron transfer flavoprotein subunit alpha/FixB family protein [Anaerococcus sp.]MDU0893739.1 electron transfer flavoprotein subunit alpha/FixB family protein [Anaerococcus sp.]MDU4026049.1 electron transfer flavoprotein subunit alpha/FixB family protein [Anaerococcus sp.]MDU5229457.1 electron transfer flavoprotein subunit alpha/FixB family protein [Anaerococcus sp.]MDU7411756.1 elect
MNEYKNVLVVCEQRDGNLQSVSLELIGKARELADELKEEVIAVIAGKKVSDLTQELISYGADKVYYVEDDKLDKYITEPYVKVMTTIINDLKPQIVLFGATSIGRDLAPRVSSRIGCGLTADCTKLEIDEEVGLLNMTRPTFGGNLLATIQSPEARPQMSTVRPGVMPKQDEDKNRTGEVNKYDIDIEDKDINIEVIEEKLADKKKIKIEDAQVLVSVGRGIGSADNMKLAYDLAEVLEGEVSSSRAVVDAGWVEKDRQVGQTGKTVRPNLYIALGISGAIQHLAGMEESDLIIAVNKNPDANIFNVADVGIVGDINEVVPELIKKIKVAKASN